MTAEPDSAGVSRDGTAFPFRAPEFRAAVLSAKESLVCVGRKTVTAGRGISSSLLIALSHLMVKIIQFQIIQRCSFHVEKSERRAKLSLFFFLIALISASTFPAAAPLQVALFDSSINFFVHPFTTQDMATFGCKSALTSLPLACFCRG